MHLSQAKANTTSQILETHTLAQTRKGRRKRKEGAGGGEDKATTNAQAYTNTKPISLTWAREGNKSACSAMEAAGPGIFRKPNTISLFLSLTHTQAHTSTHKHTQTQVVGKQKNKTAR